MIKVLQGGKTLNYKPAARVLSITAVPSKRRALSNLQRQEICKKRLEPGQATKTLSEFGKLFPDDQVGSIQVGQCTEINYLDGAMGSGATRRRGPATGSLDNRAKRGDFF